jgi:hypothetical protein
VIKFPPAIESQKPPPGEDAQRLQAGRLRYVLCITEQWFLFAKISPNENDLELETIHCAQAVLFAVLVSDAGPFVRDSLAVAQFFWSIIVWNVYEPIVEFEAIVVPAGMA